MKRLAVSLAFALCAFALAAQARIAIFDYDDRLELPDTLAKFIEAEIKAKFPGTLVEQFSGKGNDKVATETLAKVDSSGFKLVILITSDAVIIAQHALLKTPSLFANANNPLGLGFKSAKAPGGLMSGASYYISVEKKLGFYQEIYPKMKKVGVIFDDANKSRDIELAEVRAACAKMGLAFVPKLVTDVAGLKAAAQALATEGVDSVVLATSSVLYNNVQEIYDFCVGKKLPIFSFHTGGVAKGAIAAYGVDYNVLARTKLIPMIAEVLAGKSPGSMDIRFPDTADIYLNLKAAAAFGITVPPAIVAKAKSVVK